MPMLETRKASRRPRTAPPRAREMPAPLRIITRHRVRDPLLVHRKQIWSNRIRSCQVALLLAGLIVGTNPCIAEHTYRTKDDAIDVILPDGWQVDDSGIRSTLAIFYPDMASYQS